MSRAGWDDLVDGLERGARNMIGIALATAAAGIIVGTVSLTGLGLVMTEFVEAVSAGNIIVMLMLVAFICLVLGMGMPTTASYIVVSTLMAPVVVELGAQSGLVVPLVAVHMFVFYFGLMADVTPPVGLASFAAAAISRADPIKTGATAFWYSSRTAILPFMFIFNPQLLMIGIGSWLQLVLVIAMRGRGDARVRRRHPGLVPDPQPLVRIGAAAAGDVHAAAPRLLARPGDAARTTSCRRSSCARSPPPRRRAAACGCASRARRSRARTCRRPCCCRCGGAGSGRAAPVGRGARALATPDGRAGHGAVGLNSPADKAGFEQGFT